MDFADATFVDTFFGAAFLGADFGATAFFGAAFLTVTFLGAAFLAVVFLGAVFLGLAAFLGAADLAALAFLLVFFAGVFVIRDLPVNLTQNKHFFDLTHQTLNIGEYSVFHEETGSTNDALRLLYANEPIPEGTVVYTHYQKNGRGQQDNTWESDPGENLLMSVLLFPSFLLADEQVWINVVVSLALCKTAAELGRTEAFIKWPNDIYVAQKKVAGILIENSLQGKRIRYSIIGIGLNLNQKRFNAPQAASLAGLSGIPIDPKAARELLFRNLEHYYGLLKGKQNNLLWEKYHEHLMGKGKTCTFKKGEEIFEAEVMGISKQGRLHLLVGDEIRSFANKEVEWVL